MVSVRIVTDRDPFFIYLFFYIGELKYNLCKSVIRLFLLRVHFTLLLPILLYKHTTVFYFPLHLHPVSAECLSPSICEMN